MKKLPIKDLETEGLVRLIYPADLRAGVNETVKLWKQFTALPLSTKQGLPYSDGGTGVGYEYKSGVGKNADHKENFDVTTAGLTWLEQNAAQVEDTIALNFIQHATNLVGLMKPTVLEFARQTEEAFGLEGFAREVEESEPGFFVRFIHYFGDRQLGDETASAHIDQSGFTLHLYESAPGLQCMTYDGVWTDMPVSEGETVIINSTQMQLRSHGKLRALCHRVIATPETAQTGRFSAVCFVKLKNTPVYDKDRHGRLQEKPPGFNYAMSFAEFSELFKK
ncbi:MAG: isopenicillin N synthase family oxygenase [Candidatus Taylorbacteria bacterium]|nr:isopenicillin N synthase family oxygenase [Candidatus Taylorbacteria bacterium]